MTQNCNKTITTAATTFQYPFQSDLHFDLRECKQKQPAGPVQRYTMSLDYRSSTEYFVTIGVFAFLYCAGILVYYIMFEPDQAASAVPPAKFSPPVIVSIKA